MKTASRSIAAVILGGSALAQSRKGTIGFFPLNACPISLSMCGEARAAGVSTRTTARDERIAAIIADAKSPFWQASHWPRAPRRA